MLWHYSLNGQPQGPVSDDEFNGLVSAGTVQPDTLVWQEGWAEWRTYRAVTSAGSGAAVNMTADADMAVCAVSGRRLPKSDMLEFEGRWVSAEHKEEFFQRLREGVNLPAEVVYAGFGKRFVAKFLDGLIVVVVNMVVAYAIGLIFAKLFMGPGHGRGVTIMLQIVVQLSGIALALGYAIFFVRKYDATPGKMALGLRLFRADGSKLSNGRIVGRHFAEWLSAMTLAIGYFMVAFDKEQRRALHDRVCDTRVIQRER
ncbi:MAG: RDD family protein [Opitutaceae bacterium]|jgi:uncharacterized RDD family membrane protein YckC